MLISLDWIKDFVKIPDLTPQEISTKFTLGTAEVEDIIVHGEHFERIVIAEIVSIKKHPEADKLNLVSFKLKNGEISSSDLKEVVCGASNVKVGMKVPYAPLGTTFPGGFTLTPKKIRGILSEGMLCSEEELGYVEKSEGLLELDSSAPIGVNLLTYFSEVKDVILDVDNKSLTHRPDLWGHFGIAREFATLFETPLNDRFDKKWEIEILSKIESIDNKQKSPIIPECVGESSCLGYFGLSVSNIAVGSSPLWMQRRLSAVGLRPINNIVDISNYCMVELGIPLHIFDRDKIRGDKVIIKQMGENCKFTTLDEEERDLIAGDTIICDNHGPLVLGGIMGGLSSGISNDTTDIFIEVANWESVRVRKTSTRLGLRTDSSQRYEKSLDSLMLKKTMLRTLELIMELSPEAKVVGKLEYDGPDLSEIKMLSIDISKDKISKILGIDVSVDRIISILTTLGYRVTSSTTKNGFLKVDVPSYRATKDIEYEEDIIEEIGRIIGYDNIEESPPHFDLMPVDLTPIKKLERKIKDFMVIQGDSLEVYTHPMVGEKLLKKTYSNSDKNYESDFVLVNAISNEHDRMRKSLIPSMLEAAALNVKHFSSFKMFELGRSYFSSNKKGVNGVDEHHQLAIVFYDKEISCYMKLVNLTEKLLSYLNLPSDLTTKNEKFKNEVVPADASFVHPFEFLNIRLMGKMAGSIFTVHPLTLRNFKIKGNLSIAIIDLDQVSKREIKSKINYHPLPKFQRSTFDCTVLMKRGDLVENIVKLVKSIKIKELLDCKIVNRFALDSSTFAITLRSYLGDDEKTLDGKVIKDIENKIIEMLNRGDYPLKGL